MKLFRNVILYTTLISTLRFFANAQGTAFTYQGRLDEAGNPASGIYDLTFALYDAASGGTPQGNALTNTAIAVTNGLFTLALDFGNQFPGTNRWLAIGVRTNGGIFETLSPRQLLTPTPYAVNAANAVNATVAAIASSVAASNITGMLTTGQLPPAVDAGTTNQWRQDATNLFNAKIAASNNYTGTFTGNAAGLTNVGPWLNVKRDFGGIGNGVADDSVAISNAIRVAMSERKTVYFPAGTYRDYGRHSVDGSKVSFRGEGIDVTTWRLLQNTNPFSIATFNALPYFGHIKLQGNGKNTLPYTSGIVHTNGSQQFYIEYVCFEDWPGVGFDPHAVAGGTMVQCRVINNLVGARAPGYCDGQRATLWGTGNLIGYMIGGSFIGSRPMYGAFAEQLHDSYFQGVSRANAGTVHFSGFGNYITILMAEGTGNHISGYTENNNNEIMIGVDRNIPALTNLFDDAPQFVGSVTVQDYVNQGGNNNTNIVVVTNCFGLQVINYNKLCCPVNALVKIRTTAPIYGLDFDNCGQTGDLVEWNDGTRARSGRGGGLGFGVNGHFAYYTEPFYDLSVSKTIPTITRGGGNGLALTNANLVLAGGNQHITSGSLTLDSGSLSVGGNVGIGTNNPTEKLHVIGNIVATGTITPNSDRNAKTDFAPVDVAAMLEQVARLPIQQWRFNAEPAGIKHVGPMAQDFRAAFGLGEIPTAIATVDIDGVTLAAIQGLNQKVEELKKALNRKDAENAELETRLEKLEQLYVPKLNAVAK